MVYDRIQRVALIVDFDDIGNKAASERLFRRIKEQLLDVYGSPRTFFNQGDFTSTLSRNLASGRFIRVMQWQQPSGMLRFGIPRRTDGQVRMELQMGQGFGSVKSSRWSMEEFR
jgi:hypothetical protein